MLRFVFLQNYAGKPSPPPPRLGPARMHYCRGHRDRAVSAVSDVARRGHKDGRKGARGGGGRGGLSSPVRNQVAWPYSDELYRI